MKKVFESPSDLSGYLFRIVDNCGQSADRYTVVFSDGSYLGLSGNPSHPQGVSMWGEGIDPQTLQEWVDNDAAVDLALGDLPSHLVEHILYRCNEGLEDFLNDVEKRELHAVAPNRDAADDNDGTDSSLGKGIYHTKDGYRIRLDGDSPEDDPGPYATAAEVIRATLPDQYGFSGPEYRSTTDVTRMEPDQAILDKVAELEAKNDEEWERQRGLGV